MLRLSPELRASLATHDDFVPYVYAFGAWARRDRDRPKSYRCPLAAKVKSGYGSDTGAPVMICDSDAAAMDAVFCALIDNKAKRLLFAWTVVCGHDCLDTLLYANDLRKELLRKGEKFDFFSLLTMHHNLVEQARLRLRRKAGLDDFHKSEEEA